MKPSAVLLIDLENFYCSREDYCRDGAQPPYDRARFADDLEKLLGYARSMADGLPFTIRRAYANYNAARPAVGAVPQHYLRHIPDELMRQGVEPVQVFRLSHSGSKNAADMRMAMDATALLNGIGNVEHFVLVTGDADFIPVILELKRHGHAVSVIGVTGATNALIQRFVDNFELFEDLLAAEEVESQAGELAQPNVALNEVAAAIHRLLTRSHPLRFAAVKPLLSKELGHAFDPGAFGCDTTGDFLRQYQSDLGLVIRPTEHDQEIDLTGSSPPSSNGSGAKPAQPEPHSVEHYRQLLAGRAQSPAARVPVVPWPVLAWACDAVVPMLAPPSGGPMHTTALQPRLVAAAEQEIADSVRQLRAFYPLLRAGLTQPADGVYSLPAGATGEEVRRRVLASVVGVLRERLRETGAAGDVRAESLAALFEPGPALGEVAAEVAAALVQLGPAEPTAQAARAGGVHTPAGYVKLLKAGGAKGSETEAYKILPVPWPSVQRVCRDVFALLSPAAGGGPLPRAEFRARLVAAGSDFHVEHYEQHVRRALGILRVAGELTESDGTVALHPEVTSAQDLRNRALAFLLQLLQLRLEEKGVYDPIRAAAFAAALEAGPLAAAVAEEVAPAIEWLYRDSEESQPTSPEAGSIPAAEPVSADGSALALEPDLPAVEPDTPEGDLPNVELVPAATAPAPPSAGSEFADLTEGPAEQSGSGVVNIDVLTSEAVAAAVSEVEHPAPPEGAGLVVTPVTDWLGDPEPAAADAPARPATHKAITRAVAKISPPPLPHAATRPPPLPPTPPPESA